jgi:SAM-dependent methyltransferase
MGVERVYESRCIACGGVARRVGEVPYAYHFLQQSFSAPLDSGDLYECVACGLWFKYPYFPKDQVANFYRNSPETLSWNSSKQRTDFLRAASAITSAFPEGGSVLDFGCYRGGFLRLLPDRFLKFGIEPSAAASQAAAAEGIEILGEDVFSLGAQEFDCVSLFDVFEHLLEPLSTLDTLFAHIRPGGLLCIGTGFADSPAFHRAASKYSYVCIPEHSCFLTRPFMEFLGSRFRSGYQFSTISRVGRNIRSIVRAIAINFVNSPMLVLKGKKAIRRFYPIHRLRIVTSRGLLPLTATEDHVVVVFRKAG